MEFENDVFVTTSTTDSWKEVAGNFGKSWNFHHACGALDGKHIAIKKPKKSGSAYYNYKGFFSIVLLGLECYLRSIPMLAANSPNSASRLLLFL